MSADKATNSLHFRLPTSAFRQVISRLIFDHFGGAALEMEPTVTVQD